MKLRLQTIVSHYMFESMKILEKISGQNTKQISNKLDIDVWLKDKIKQLEEYRKVIEIKLQTLLLKFFKWLIYSRDNDTCNCSTLWTDGDLAFPSLDRNFFFINLKDVYTIKEDVL